MYAQITYMEQQYVDNCRRYEQLESPPWAAEFANLARHVSAPGVTKYQLNLNYTWCIFVPVGPNTPVASTCSIRPSHMPISKCKPSSNSFPQSSSRHPSSSCSPSHSSHSCSAILPAIAVPRLRVFLFPLDCACGGGAPEGGRLVLVREGKLVREGRTSASRRRGRCRHGRFWVLAIKAGLTVASAVKAVSSRRI